MNKQSFFLLFFYLFVSQIFGQETKVFTNLEIDDFDNHYVIHAYEPKSDTYSLIIVDCNEVIDIDSLLITQNRFHVKVREIPFAKIKNKRILKLFLHHDLIWRKYGNCEFSDIKLYQLQDSKSDIFLELNFTLY